MPIHSPVPIARRRRRALLRGVRRAVALATVILAAVGTANAQAGANVQVGAGGSNYVSSDQIKGGSGSALYTPPGQSQAITLQGMSLGDLMAGGDPGTVASVSIGGLQFPASEVPVGAPLVATGGTGTYFFQGAAGGQPQYAKANGWTIHIVLNSAPLADTTPSHLDVTIAGPSQVPARSTASFTAQVNNATGPFTYTWVVFSQAFGASDSITRYFPNDCICSVAVTVNGPGKSSGVAGFTLTVGNPHRTATGTGLGTANGTGSGAGGTGHGNGGTGGGTNTGGTKGATQPKAAPKPAVRPPAAVPQPGAAAKAATARAAAVSSQPVRGILLADIGSPLDLHLSPPPPSGSPGAAKKTVGGSSGIGALVGGIALALAIVGLGGLAERRRVTLRLA